MQPQTDILSWLLTCSYCCDLAESSWAAGKLGLSYITHCVSARQHQEGQLPCRTCEKMEKKFIICPCPSAMSYTRGQRPLPDLWTPLARRKWASWLISGFILTRKAAGDRAVSGDLGVLGVWPYGTCNLTTYSGDGTEQREPPTRRLGLWTTDFSSAWCRAEHAGRRMSPNWLHRLNC
jgi:hypothetical protein